MILQISTDVVEVGPDLYNETCVASSCDGYEATDTNVVQISDTEDDDEPVLVIYSSVKAECKVSCMLVCPLLGIFHRYPELPVCLIHRHVSGSLHKMTVFNRFQRAYSKNVCRELVFVVHGLLILILSTERSFSRF